MNCWTPARPARRSMEGGEGRQGQGPNWTSRHAWKKAGSNGLHRWNRGQRDLLDKSGRLVCFCCPKYRKKKEPRNKVAKCFTLIKRRTTFAISVASFSMVIELRFFSSCEFWTVVSLVCQLCFRNENQDEPVSYMAHIQGPGKLWVQSKRRRCDVPEALWKWRHSVLENTYLWHLNWRIFWLGHYGVGCRVYHQLRTRSLVDISFFPCFCKWLAAKSQSLPVKVQVQLMDWKPESRETDIMVAQQD